MAPRLFEQMRESPAGELAAASVEIHERAHKIVEMEQNMELESESPMDPLMDLTEEEDHILGVLGHEFAPTAPIVRFVGKEVGDEEFPHLNQCSISMSNRSCSVHEGNEFWGQRAQADRDEEGRYEAPSKSSSKKDWVTIRES